MVFISKSTLSAALLACAWIVVPETGQAAPYPKEGKLIEWVQPDGSFLALRVFGDEFYGRTETKDGFTVVFNEADRTYYYAEPTADGKALIPTGTAAHFPVPPGLGKKTRSVEGSHHFDPRGQY